MERPNHVHVELSRVAGGSAATAQHFSRRATRPQQAKDLRACFFDPVGINDGHCGSCSSVLSRRNALYDAPRVIIKHCSRTARQCATSQSSEERRKLAKQSRRQLNRALLAREPKPASSGAVWQCSTAHALSFGREPRGPSRSVIAPVVRPASMQRVVKSYQEELCDDVDWRSPFQD